MHRGSFLLGVLAGGAVVAMTIGIFTVLAIRAIVNSTDNGSLLD